MRPDMLSALEDHLDAFDAAWQQPVPPRPEDFLPPRSGPEYREILVGLVCIDLERRTKAGEQARVEEYLRRFPELRDGNELLELVLLERDLRRRLDPACNVEEYPARFPELASQLEGPLFTMDLAPVGQGNGQASPAGDELDLRDHVLLDLVGRGGMGEVYRGRDPALARNLAVKVLRPELRGHAEAERRFQQEARINGVLQHPSIVPVHNLGRLSDGRLYFTMKLVRGRTLAELLDQRSRIRQNAGDADPRSGERGYDLPELLGIFEKVCQALAYAHSRKVIHRDLKPANVMVGAFGEVQVMDWGLAKILPSRVALAPGEQQTAAESTLGVVFAAKPSGSTADEYGPTGVVGTPAYMAPEQARGASDDIDERADVFGLGGILCAILTGQPPYQGGGRDEVMRKAAAGDLAEALARLDGCGADAELAALCRDCLAAERAGRPRNAGEVAARVAAYQTAAQERLRKAELERAAAAAREQEAQATAAAERKARRRTRALAVAVLLLVVAGGGGAWWVQQRRQATDAGVAGLIGEAERLFDQARSETAPWTDIPRLYAQARDTAHKADDLARGGGASAAPREQAAELARSLDEAAAAAERDRRLLLALLEVRGPHELPRYRTDEKGLAMALVEPSAEEQFRAAFEAWDPTVNMDTVPTADLAEQLKRRPARVVTEVVAALDEWAHERRQAKPPRDWRRVTELAAALDGAGAESQELRALLTRSTLSQEWALGVLAMALRPVPVPFDLALTGQRAQLRRLTGQTDVAGAPVLRLLTLSRAFLNGGEVRLARELLQKALRARPPREQDVPLYQLLGQLHAGLGRWPEAVECFTATRALRPELGESLAFALMKSGRGDEGLALYKRLEIEHAANPNPWLYLRHGNALAGEGRHKEAEEAYRQAIRLERDFPEALVNLGAALSDQGRYKEAETTFRRAIRLKPDIPEAHFNLGNALLGQNRNKEAEATYRQAIRLRPDFPAAHINLGNVLDRLGQTNDAEAALRQAVRLKPDFPEAHIYLGNALNRQGRYQEAETALRQAIRLKPDLLAAHIKLGNALHGQARYKEAEAAYRQTIRLKYDYPDGHNNLGAALYLQDRHKEAEAAIRQAIHLKHDYPEAHYNLGNVVLAQGRHKEAEAAFRQAIRLKYDYPGAHFNLGNTLSAQGRHKEAEAAYRQVIHLKHDYPEAHVNLGNALLGQGRHKEAEATYRQTIRLKHDYPEAYFNLGNALYGQGRHKEAEANYRQATRLKHDFREAHFNLGVALTDQGRHKEAEAAFRRAIRLKHDYPEAHYSLGNALLAQGRNNEAEAEFRQTIRLEHDFRGAHNDLGIALHRQGRYREAEEACRQAVHLTPDYPVAHCLLGHCLREQGRFAEALEALRRGHALGSKVPGWRYPSTDWVRQCKRLVELDRRLPALLAGDAEPANPAERIEFAAVCALPCKRLHAAAARFYADAFAAEAKLADDLQQQHRYNAACSAVLAAAGQAEDAKPLPDRVPPMLRRQALRWLRDDLAAYTKLARRAEARPAVRQQLELWQKDADLSTVRDKEALDRLPADERLAWRRLWEEVDALIKKVEERK